MTNVQYPNGHTRNPVARNRAPTRFRGVWGISSQSSPETPAALAGECPVFQTIVDRAGRQMAGSSLSQ
jgi:hypothetical protein